MSTYSSMYSSVAIRLNELVLVNVLQLRCCDLMGLKILIFSWFSRSFSDPHVDLIDLWRSVLWFVIQLFVLSSILICTPHCSGIALSWFVDLAEYLGRSCVLNSDGLSVISACVLKVWYIDYGDSSKWWCCCCFWCDSHCLWMFLDWVVFVLMVCIDRCARYWSFSWSGGVLRVMWHSWWL